MTERRVIGVSVIIPAYNGMAWIERSIRSVAEQASSVPLEILVVDDCSTDNTAAFVEGLRIPGVRVISTGTNRGTAGARNCGMEHASYDWLGFNDQDDIWAPGKLAAQVELLERHPEYGGVSGGAGRLAKDGLTQWSFQLMSLRWSPIFNPPLKRAPDYDPTSEGTTYLQTFLFEKRLVQEVGGFRERLPLSDDIDLILKIARISQLGYVNQTVFLYRLGDDNQTAPSVVGAKRFLAAQAYASVAHEARVQGRPEVDVEEFFASFEPDPEELVSFQVRNGMRQVNTVWVNRGTAAAVREVFAQLARHPKLFSQHLAERVQWWVRRRAS
jgi:glycosyltransferase involved in cell wall biosynthesis